MIRALVISMLYRAILAEQERAYHEHAGFSPEHWICIAAIDQLIAARGSA